MTSEFFYSLGAAVRDALEKRGIAKATASTASDEAIKAVVWTMGGLTIYIPMRNAERVQELAEKVFAEFDGHNRVELARKYKISETHVRRLVNKIRAQRRSSLEKE